MTSPIRVLLVDDSPLALAKLKRIVSADERMEVVGAAMNGAEALKMIPKLAPTVICTDLFMPQMDGLDLTREVMRLHPTPILVVSVGVQEGSGERIFDLLRAGALDVLPKPVSDKSADFESIARELKEKICILARVKVFRRGENKPPVSGETEKFLPLAKHDQTKIVLIGASTGGPQTLERILQLLPTDTSFPVVCVQHIGGDFIESMVHWLDRAVDVSVGFAEHGKAPEPGKVYFPPRDRQLRFLPDGKFDCRRAKSYNDFLPSVDVTFLSAAEHYEKYALACILTGMGCDGAQGIKAIFEKGGRTVAQSGGSCVIDGMPKAARELGVISDVCTPEEVGKLLSELSKQK